MKISDWVHAARKHAQLSQEKLGDHLNVTKGNVSSWEKDRHNPSFEQMAVISKVTGYPMPDPDSFYVQFGSAGNAKSDLARAESETDSPSMLIRWKNEIHAHHATPRAAPEPINLTDNPEYPSIRRVALKAQAGVTGYAVEYMNDDGPPIVFRKDWYAAHNYKPDKMLAMRVAGESMIPSLYASDLIVINSAQTDPKDGIAFVVAYEGEIVVKRLVRDAGQWWLTSDNPDQRRYPRKSCDSSTEIVGEVVYRQTERI